MTSESKNTTRKSSITSILLLLVVGIALGRWFFPARGGESTTRDPAETASSAEAVAEVWTCAMHPQVRLPEPGDCPICGMELILSDEGSGGAALGPRDLRLSPGAVALAEIETAQVERHYVSHEVRMVGKVAYDETRVSTITTWIPGRLEKLFVDYTGVEVREGEHLVEIYSPTLYSAQQELLQAIVTEKKLGASSLELLRNASKATIISSREKLRLYGMTEGQIEEIVQRGTPDERVTIYAPTGGIVIHKQALEGMYVEEGTKVYTIADLSKVWVVLDAYESDLAWLRYGQDVSFTVAAYPDRTLHGRVAFIDPSLDESTRTVKVRLNVENGEARLKPGMFVSATSEALLSDTGKVIDENLAGKWMCPMHPEVIADGPAVCPECGMDLRPVEELGFTTDLTGNLVLVIPATAPLLTGKRAVVYVQLPNTEEPTFQGRVITLGPRAGDFYVVRDGLEEGERVVVQGAFKIDSELQIRAQPSMMSPEGGKTSPGHRHGDSADGMAPEMEPGQAAAPLPLGGAERARVASALEAAMPAYLEAHAHLVEDQDARSSFKAFLSALLSEAELETVAPLEKATRALLDAADIEVQRDAFVTISSLYLDLLDASGASPAGADTLGVYHCPMAADGEGADWIQPKGGTENPYYGTAMSKCGSLIRDLTERP